MYAMKIVNFSYKDFNGNTFICNIFKKKKEVLCIGTRTKKKFSSHSIRICILAEKLFFFVSHIYFIIIINTSSKENFHIRSFFFEQKKILQ